MDDKTKAEALRIAERWLISKGSKFTPSDVGRVATEILNAMKEGEA